MQFVIKQFGKEGMQPMMARSDDTHRSRLHSAAAVVLMITLVASIAACSSSSKKSGSPPATAGASSGSASRNAAAVQVLLKQGINQAQAKMYDQAVTTFNDVLALDPTNVYALYNLGVINQTQNNTAAALDYYNRAATVDSTYTPALYNKAIILESTDLNAALALYKQIVAINPKASTAWLRMAFVYAKQGQPALANAARAKAVALDPTLAKYPLPAACGTPNC
jgi:tetratricopeptide (TPR) repeat protein